MHRLLPFLFCASSALAVAACTTSEQCDAAAEPPCPSCIQVSNAAGCPAWTCPGECNTGSSMADASSDVSTDTARPSTTPTAPPTTVGSNHEGPPYRYVRINDLSPRDDTIHGGADIDAVVLDKADGRQVFATTVEAFWHAGGAIEGPEVDPSELLGAPDAFFDYPNVALCDLERGHLSLGGEGGFVVVGLGDAIEPGDQVTVLETGGCYENDGPEGIPEAVQVQISVGFDIHDQWFTIGNGEGPVISLAVPDLPVLTP